LSPTPNIQDWRDNYKGAICYQSYRRFFFDSVSVHYDSSCLGITLLYTLTGKDVERFCIDYDQVSKKFSNWIGRLGYCSYSEHLSYDEIFKSAESARVALNTEEVPSSSRLTPPSPDPDPTASTPLIDRDTSRSSNKPLYLQLILIGAIVTLGWIVAAKYSVPTLDQQQNQLPRSIGK
jgi:hypothetical protein